MRQCAICGYELHNLGTCQRVCRYDKQTGRINQGPACHVGCAEKHHSDHHDLKNPRSLASMSATTKAGA